MPMVDLATRIMLGATLAAQGYAGYPEGLWPVQPLVAVKGPVFSMAKLMGAEMALGPEMKSTGEVMGIDRTYPAALRKALVAAGIDVPARDGVAFVSIAERDKAEALPVLRELGALATASSRLRAPRACSQRRGFRRAGGAHQPKRRHDSAADPPREVQLGDQHDHGRDGSRARGHRDLTTASRFAVRRSRPASPASRRSTPHGL